MIPFLFIAVTMVALALAWVLVPLLRRGSPGVGRELSNLAILRDQLRELDADLATGTMPRDRYEQAKRELEERALEESREVGGAAVASQSTAWTAAIVAGAIPIAALLLYVTLGNPEALGPTARAAKGGGEHEVTRTEVEAMAEKLAARLQTEPDNADLLADYADAVGASEGGLKEKSQELIERALRADPTHWKALALAGTAAFNKKDYRLAVTYWERMKATVPPGSSIAGSIDASIAEARQLGGLGAGPVPAPPSVPSAQAAAPKASASAPASVTAPAGAAPATVGGTVSLAPALAAKVSPTDAVYIFARAAEGPRMPLAILKKQVKDLPAAFTFDDSMAMAPNFALSNFPSVIIGARVSKSGNPVPQSGDLEGLSSAVKLGASGLAIVIDRTLP